MLCVCGHYLCGFSLFGLNFVRFCPKELVNPRAFVNYYSQALGVNDCQIGYFSKVGSCCFHIFFIVLFLDTGNLSEINLSRLKKNILPAHVNQDKKNP